MAVNIDGRFLMKKETHEIKFEIKRGNRSNISNFVRGIKQFFRLVLNNLVTMDLTEIKMSKTNDLQFQHEMPQRIVRQRKKDSIK